MSSPGCRCLNVHRSGSRLGFRLEKCRARLGALAFVVRHEATIRAIAAASIATGSLTGREAHKMFRETVISAPCVKMTDRERRVLRSRRGAHWRDYWILLALRDAFMFGLQLQKCVVHPCDLLRKLANFRGLLLGFIQQHRRKLAVAHPIDSARLIADH